jgi:hypothetical protein
MDLLVSKEVKVKNVDQIFDTPVELEQHEYQIVANWRDEDAVSKLQAELFGMSLDEFKDPLGNKNVQFINLKAKSRSGRQESRRARSKAGTIGIPGRNGLLFQEKDTVKQRYRNPAFMQNICMIQSQRLTNAKNRTRA